MIGVILYNFYKVLEGGCLTRIFIERKQNKSRTEEIFFLINLKLVIMPMFQPNYFGLDPEETR